MINLMASFLIILAATEAHTRLSQEILSTVGRSKRWAFLGPPTFDPKNPNNVTARIGSHVFLPCRVNNLGNKSVSWIRTADSHLLAVDDITYITDPRFGAWHDRDIQSWVLQIQYVQKADLGLYECQVSSDPKISQFIKLNVLEPTIILKGEKEKFVKFGSEVVLECTMRNVLDQAPYAFWYHNLSVIDIHSSSDYSMSIINTSNSSFLSTLAISSIKVELSGNYSCHAGGHQSNTIFLHVLTGENPAAILRDTNDSRRTYSSGSFTIMALCNILYQSIDLML